MAGVGVKYGKDSSEYEMAGGTRASEINYNPSERTTGRVSAQVESTCKQFNRRKQ